MFLYLFSIALVVSCVICIKKRCYIAFFLPMMLFLPDYYGYEVSPALPLLTVKRMLFIVLYIYVFSVYRKNISLLLTKKNITPPVILISLSFFFRIASNLYYITTYGQATKTIFFIVFEHILLLVATKISSLSKVICQSQQRYLVVNGRYANNFNDNIFPVNT